MLSVEFFVLLLAGAVIILGLPLVAISYLVGRWRPFTKLFAVSIGVSLAALTIVFFAAEPVRLLFAQGVMRKAEPIIASIEAFKIKNGAYPISLEQAGTDNANTFWYKRWHNIYYLQFRTDGPPFGYFFVYRPDHDYSDKDEFSLDVQPVPGDHPLIKIGDWSWYHKM
ncbi:MAG: hypothetical protein C5B53_03050 [Candidatus Melainabacteria bacterium]|nr:MAG: hypothetical protein C5B53_03050 [Candidatus Melainabacteria bacterium]